MKIKTASTLVFFLFAASGINGLNSQEVIDDKTIISGTVYDNETSLPLIQAGVNYFDPSTQEFNGTVTDNEGKYILEVPVGIQMLTFTHEGMEKKTVELGDVTELDVYLEKEDERLKQPEKNP